MANNEVAVKPKFEDYLLSELEKNEEGLSKDFNKQRFVLNALALTNEKPELLQKFSAQIMPNLLKAAVMDVDLYRSEAYLIPYGNQLQFQLSYKGCKKIAKKYSVRPITDIAAEIVREGDVFEKNVTDDNTTFTFKPKPFNDGAIIGAFAYVQYADGKCFVEEMTKKEIDVVKSKSKSGGGGPWKDFYGEMAKKAVIKRLTKHLELDFENASQQGIFNTDDEILTKEKVKVDDPFSDLEVIDG